MTIEAVYYPTPGRAELSGMDVLSLIFSICGVSLLGLILGWSSHSQAKASGFKQHGVGVAGLVLGAIGSFFWSLWLLIIVAALAS